MRSSGQGVVHVTPADAMRRRAGAKGRVLPRTTIDAAHSGAAIGVVDAMVTVSFTSGKRVMCLR